MSEVFFSGGDQLRITSRVGDTPIDERVHEIYEAGGILAGISAGASVMNDTFSSPTFAWRWDWACCRM
ncbi:Type 1 glutamine amidotransferase-like domain-containing protein [Mesorhizobium sp. M1066]|uniref:Type 1 glutamine amidotransferase-like domain-containing protein n=1 Tax=unclassified Mesorhizobium TaxID=325217 RepID=UPI00333A2771